MRSVHEWLGYLTTAHRYLLTLLLLQASVPAHAADASLTGFGTIGHTVSDQPYTYQRFVDQRGTFMRDSVLGAQLDLSLTPTLSATLQGRHAASTVNDDHTSGRLTWAFVSWRPHNDWLLRIGRLRAPMFMHSENTDVGVTYDVAHQPTELYAASLTPTTDLDGFSISQTSSFDQGELTLDAYHGRARITTRIYRRDDIPGYQNHGADRIPFSLTARGLVASWRTPADDLLRVGMHRLVAEFDNYYQSRNYPHVTDTPGISPYYKVIDEIPGPPIPRHGRIDYQMLTLGFDLGLQPNWRLLGEYSTRRQQVSTQMPRINAGYLTLTHRIGRWTPYLQHGLLRSTGEQLGYYEAINGNRITSTWLDAASLRAANLSQRAGADTIYAFDQRSLALGTSYRIDHHQILKAEWQQVRTGRVSQLLDAPQGEESGHRRINLWSLSYSFSF